MTRAEVCHREEPISHIGARGEGADGDRAECERVKVRVCLRYWHHVHLGQLGCGPNDKKTEDDLKHADFGPELKPKPNVEVDKEGDKCDRLRSEDVDVCPIKHFSLLIIIKTKFKCIFSSS